MIIGYFLKFLRRLYTTVVDNKHVTKKTFSFVDLELASNLIYETLSKNNPCMIARVGANESGIISNYLGIKLNSSCKDFIAGKNPAWWWDKRIFKPFNKGAGFFPMKIELIEKYCELCLDDFKFLDILGVWSNQERAYIDKIEHVKKVYISYLEPYFSKNPWSRILKDKKVLVIHPFAETIKKQYQVREKLFENALVLPKFDLKILKSVQSAAGNKTKFLTWFEALNFMKEEINKIDFDIALIGCGAYGFNLAAHIKKIGKQSVHLGGSLQVLFGIKGKRFENPNQTNGMYLELFNDYWTRPSNEERPQFYSVMEDGCYW